MVFKKMVVRVHSFCNNICGSEHKNTKRHKHYKTFKSFQAFFKNKGKISE
jgi:hypothetical protein